MSLLVTNESLLSINWLSLSCNFHYPQAERNHTQVHVKKIERKGRKKYLIAIKLKLTSWLSAIGGGNLWSQDVQSVDSVNHSMGKYAIDELNLRLYSVRPYVNCLIVDLGVALWLLQLTDWTFFANLLLIPLSLYRYSFQPFLFRFENPISLIESRIQVQIVNFICEKFNFYFNWKNCDLIYYFFGTHSFQIF